MEIKANSTADDLKQIGFLIHHLSGGLPVTIRSKENNGLRFENGQIIDSDYTGPILEEAIETGVMVKKTPSSGIYQGMEVIVVPLVEDGEVLCVVGVMDVTKGVASDIIAMSRVR